MSSNPVLPASKDQRYQRYLPIVQFVSSQRQFDLAAVKDACRDQRPALVTRIVNELLEQGWLIQESDENTYSWNSGRGPFSAESWLKQKLFSNQVKAAPQGDRPRERLLKLGAEQLRDAELIAILIRSGRPGESAVEAGQKIAQQFAGRWEQLPAAGRGELESISPAVQATAYCQIMAGIELGRRVAAAGGETLLPEKIAGSCEAIAFCRDHFSRLSIDARQEEFHIVTLDTKNRVIDTHCITVGTLDASLVHPREVFRPAIKDSAAAIILVHNHPSGDPTPSPQDLAVTRRLEESGKSLGIEVLDHIIVARTGAVSIRES